MKAFVFLSLALALLSTLYFTLDLVSAEGMTVYQALRANKAVVYDNSVSGIHHQTTP